MFFRKRKVIKSECDHEWFEVGTRNIFVSDYGSIYIDGRCKDFTFIYCPICNTHSKKLTEDWLVIQKAQEIRKEYYKSSEVAESGRNEDSV